MDDKKILEVVENINLRTKKYRISILLLLGLDAFLYIYPKLSFLKFIIFFIATLVATFEYNRTLKIIENVLFVAYKKEFEEFKKNSPYGSSWFRVKIFMKSRFFENCVKGESVEILLTSFKTYNKTRILFLVVTLLFLF